MKEMKELKEINNLIEKLIKNINENEEKNKNNQEDAIKSIKEQLEKNNEVLLFGTENGHILYGPSVSLLSVLDMIIFKLRAEYDYDLLANSIITALTCREDKKEIVIDRDKINELLEVMKELI